MVERRPDLAPRQALPVRQCRDHTEAGATAPIPAYVASFSQPSIELAGWLGCGLIVAPFAAAMTFGGLRQAAERHQQASTRHGRRPGRLMCSYFIHFADTPAEDEAARARQIRYFKECALVALPGDPRTTPPSYGYLSTWSSGWANCVRKS